MTNITAALVKELRDKTGAGMMDCKKALQENAADVEAAVDWLRSKGLAAAAKKAGRVASEGLVAVHTDGPVGAVVEVNSETDFVARNEQFQAFAANMATLAKDTGGDIAALQAADYPATGRNVADELTQMIATIGENMSLRRAAVVKVDKGVVGSYVHGAVSSGMGRIGVLVGLQSAGDPAKLAELGKQICMHIAAAAPEAVSVDSLDPVAVERERSVLVEQARESGKPENIIEKMVEGRVRKFYQEVVLLQQTWVHDGESTVAKVLEQAKQDVGAEVNITEFVRFSLGEGIEKQESDFAAEVAAQVAG